MCIKDVSSEGMIVFRSVSRHLCLSLSHGYVFASSLLIQSQRGVDKRDTQEVNLANMATLRGEHGDWKYGRL